MSDDVKIGIVGAAGRMGQMLVRQVTETAGCKVAGATEGSWQRASRQGRRGQSPASAISALRSSRTRRR